jgi:hypothetical protein
MNSYVASLDEITFLKVSSGNDCEYGGVHDDTRRYSTIQDDGESDHQNI